jgi:hypothetical protein
VPCLHPGRCHVSNDGYFPFLRTARLQQYRHYQFLSCIQSNINATRTDHDKVI